MASSFIYRPHVQTLDGVVTPDVLIDSLMLAAKGEAKLLPVPIDRITMDIEMQAAGTGNGPDAALALIGAGAGTLLSIASNHGEPGGPAARLACAKPICRHAWRLADVAAHLSDLILKTAVIDGTETKILQEGSLGDCLDLNTGEVSAGAAVLCTGLPSADPDSGHNFQIEMTDPVLERCLRFQYWAREI
ncbi:MAG: DUF2848 family protein [Alphaproteobacteria bacterium]